jgi:hypothetical protein
MLFHNLLVGDLHHKYLKGCPSRNCVPLDKVNVNMQVLLTQPTDDVGAMDNTGEDAVGSDYLESLQFLGLSAEETYVKPTLPDGMYGKGVLSLKMP